MFSFRRLALVLALGVPAAHFALAQDSSSSSTPATPDQAQQPATSNQGSVSVQSRIHARREQRRAQAIKDVYSHLYEVSTGMAYMRMSPGHTQRVGMYAWDAGITRYYSQRLGATIDARGYYGTAYVGLNPYSITRPAISVYTVMGGPTYRFYMQPKYSISGRVLGGYAQNNFSGDTDRLGGPALKLYPDEYTYAGAGSIVGEYNLGTGLSLRLSGEDLITGFGSTVGNSVGFTGGFVFRFGKQ